MTRPSSRNALGPATSSRWNWNTRLTVWLAAATLFLATIIFYGSDATGVILYRLIVDGGLTILWIAAAAGLGGPILSRMLPRDFQSTRVLQLITSIALGLGILSLLTLCLGLCGWLSRSTAIAMIASGLASGAILCWKHRNTLRTSAQNWRCAPAGWTWLWVAVMPLLGITTIAALVPPGVLWGDEPNGYDVVEYHLQVPREWYDTGRIVPLEHNVFSYFPFNVEMHYLLAMELQGGPWAGMYTAQFMHLAMCALAALAVGAAVGGGRGILAGVAMAATPWAARVAPVAYVEGGVMLYGALALIWALRAIDSGAWHDMALAGAMAGFACGVKLTNVPLLLVAIPVALTVAICLRRSAGGLSVRVLLPRISIFLLAGLILFSPWLVRNWSWVRNPLFPEAMNVLGHGHFSPVQVQRWQEAYLPDINHRSAAGRLKALAGQVLGDERYGYVLLPLGIVAALLARSARAGFLLMMLLILTGVWLGFTHLQSRFFILGIPIAALLIAQVQARWWPPLVAACIAAMLAVGIIDLHERLMRYLDAGFINMLGRENLAGLRPIDDQKDRIDLVGDVSPFLYQLPSANLGYRTVFDVKTEPGRSVVQDWLNGSDLPIPRRIIVVDPGELARLSRTYYAIPPLSTEELQKLASRPDVKIEGR